MPRASDVGDGVVGHGAGAFTCLTTMVMVAPKTTGPLPMLPGSTMFGVDVVAGGAFAVGAADNRDDNDNANAANDMRSE